MHFKIYCHYPTPSRLRDYLSKFLPVIAVVQLTIKVITGHDIPTECARYCNSKRPENTDGKYKLLCNQTDDPGLCQAKCENECPLDEVCVKENIFDDEDNKFYNYWLKCPGSRTLNPMPATLLLLVLAAVAIALLLLLGVLALGYIAYKWMEQRKLLRRELTQEEEFNQGTTTDDTQQNEKDNDMSPDAIAPEKGQFIKTASYEQDGREGFCSGDTCFGGMCDLEKTPSSLSSL